VTNVRFTSDKKRVLSIGGADHAIFQWRFIPEDKAESLVDKLTPVLQSQTKEAEEDFPDKYSGYLDTNSEESDSEMSGKEIDSDIENEKEISYDREVYKEDLVVSETFLLPRLLFYLLN
jgi:hypothetical protein